MPKNTVSLISRNLATKAANEERDDETGGTTKQAYWEQLGNQLEIEGVVKTQISKTAKHLIEDILWEKKFKKQGIPRDEVKLNAGHWFKIMSKNGWVDPNQVRNSKDIDTSQDQGNSSLNGFAKENYEYIKLIYDTMNFFKESVLPRLKTENFMSLIKTKDVKLEFHDWNAQLEIAKSLFNQKEKVPTNFHHIMLHCIGTMSSNNQAAREYFKQRLAYHTLTGKQLIKYRKGIVKNGPALFKPSDRMTAMMWNYLGVQCDQCFSWRMLEVPLGNGFTAFCLDCDAKEHITHPVKCDNCAILFFEESFDELKNKTKCPYCNEKFTGIVLEMIKKVERDEALHK